MENTVQETAKLVVHNACAETEADSCRLLDQTEKDVLTSVALKEPTYSGLEYQLVKYVKQPQQKRPS